MATKSRMKRKAKEAGLPLIESRKKQRMSLESMEPPATASDTSHHLQSVSKSLEALSEVIKTPGTVNLFLDPSGMGKTTTFKCLYSFMLGSSSDQKLLYIDASFDRKCDLPLA